MAPLYPTDNLKKDSDGPEGALLGKDEDTADIDNKKIPTEEQDKQPPRDALSEEPAIKPSDPEPFQAILKSSDDDAVKPQAEVPVQPPAKPTQPTLDSSLPDDDDDPLGGFKFRGSGGKPVKQGASRPAPRPSRP